MLFNSIQFILFFIIVTGLYFVLPYKSRWSLLLVSSCYFYMAFVPVYILILGFTIIIDYFAGIWIENSSGPNRKILLTASLVSNIGVLAFFKYFNFINENLTYLLQSLGFSNPVPFLSILLPIGLSFHTFQAMSYTIEVFRGHQKAERHFGIYSLYVMFYPQLVAGPIERPQNLLHQFREEHDFEYTRIVEGLKLMLWGFFKKLVIADRLAIYVNAVYNNPTEHSGTTLILATIFFAFQVYCDFSGYSDIAIGAARVMGFKLMDNFKRPFFSLSISDFWRRWHISLSTWFRDYLYISMGGSRVSVSRRYFNLFFVFLICGLWHGADWNYVAWGAITGFYIVFAIITQNLRKRINKLIGIEKLPKLNYFFQVVITFLLFCFSLIFFRANNLSESFIIIQKIFTSGGPLFYDTISILGYSFMGILLLLLIEIKQEFYQGRFSFFNNKNWVVRYASYSFILVLIVLFGVFDGGQFIYFQF